MSPFILTKYDNKIEWKKNKGEKKGRREPNKRVRKGRQESRKEGERERDKESAFNLLKINLI